jgi:hypothetical protein
VPVAIIVEEHHEAFFVWNYFAKKNVLSARRNTLLHVDKHADMGRPVLQTSLKHCDGDLRQLLSFTQRQLGIADFIVPAVYKGLFDQIYWIHRGCNLFETKKTIHVVSQNGDGRNLLITDNIHYAGPFNPDRTHATIHQIEITNSIAPSGPVVLDIDLDYFYCDDHGGGSWEIQVTEEEYTGFVTDPYHKLRLTLGGRAQAEKRNGKFFFINHDHGIQDSQGVEKEKETINRRIQRFVDWLQHNSVEPVLIDICRSRFSGYTPERHWRLIEQRLLEKLQTLFPVTTKGLDEIVREEGLD